jgi:membrane-associated phospholipid phosphatase
VSAAAGRTRGHRTALILLALALVGAATALPFDREVSQFFRTVDPRLIATARALTDIGKSDYSIWGCLIGMAVLLLQRRALKETMDRAVNRWLFGALGFVLASVSLSGIATNILKDIIGRARPVLLEREGFYGLKPFTFEAIYNSFPSGHATTFLALAVSLGFLMPRLLKPLVVICAALATTRIIINAHFVSDVFGGAFMGGGVTILVALYFRRRGWVFAPGTGLPPRLLPEGLALVPRALRHAGDGEAQIVRVARPVSQRIQTAIARWSRAEETRADASEPLHLFHPAVALLMLAITAALSLLFFVWPGIDLAVSRTFLNAENIFVLRDDPIATAVRRIVPLTEAIGVLLLLGGIAGLFTDKVRRFVAPKAAFFFVACLIVAPGLLVNTVLKDQWGRPRPNQVAELNQPPAREHQKVWVVSDQCERNCSFVSGDVSIAFTWLAAAPFVAAVYRRRVIGGIVAVGLVVAAVRVGQGGHFLSDVTLSACLTYLAIFALYRAFYGRAVPRLAEPPPPAER